MSEHAEGWGGDRTVDPRRDSIAGFDVESVLGEGRHSVVFLCDDDGSKYAVKWLKPTPSNNREDLERRFASEAATLARLEHRVFPRVWTTGKADGRPYMVLEVLSGEPLDEILTSKTFDGPALLEMGIELARGLVELHGAEAVHRDLKPANIHWDGARARIFDLGLIEAPERSVPSDGGDDEEARGEVVGTLAYAAPEQLRVLKRTVDERSDLYGLGAVLYAAAAGRPPFEASRVEEIIQAHATRSAPSVRAHLSEDWSELADVIDQLLEKDPSDRPSSAARVVELLSGAAPEDPTVEASFAGEAAGAPSEGSDGRRRGRRRTNRGARRSREQDALAPLGSGSPVGSTELGPGGGLPEPLVRRFRLVGRREAHRRLRDAAREVLQSRAGGVALVRGGEASGREALVGFVLEDLDDETGGVVRLDGRPEANRPLDGVRRLVERLLAEGKRRESVREVLEQVFDEFSASPAVRQFGRSLLEAQDVAESVTDDGLRTSQFLSELARLLARLADRTDTRVIAVDAADRLDLSSLRVLRALFPLLEQWPLFVVMTAERDAGPGQTFFERVGSDIDAFGGADEEADASAPRHVGVTLEPVTLEPLDGDEVVRFVDCYLNAPLDAGAFVEQLRATTGGRPVHLERLLDHLIERGVLAPDWEGWRVEHAGELDLPPKLRALLTRSLEELEEPSRTVLTAAAVWGRRFPIEPLTRAVDLDDRDVRSVVDEAVDQDLLFRNAESEESTYAFAHDAVRGELLDEASDSVRRESHQAFAEWLDAREGGEFRTAHHYARGDGSTPERTAEVCRRAAERAASEHAVEQTLEFGEAVVEATAELSASVPAEISYLLGWALAQLERVDEAVDHLERAVEEADDRQKRVRYRLMLATIDASRIRFERVDANVREVLAELGESVPGSTPWLVLRAVVAYLAILWYERLDPREEPRRPDDARLELASGAYRLLSISAMFTDRPLTGLAAELGRKRAALRLGPSPELIEAHGTSAAMAALAGDFDGAQEELERGREVAETVEDPYADTQLDLCEIVIRHTRGDPVAAARASASLLRNRGDQLVFYERSFAIEDLAVNYALRGHSDRVIDWYHRWRALHGASSDETVPSTMHSTVVYHARLAGDAELADRQLEISENHFDPDGAPFYWRSHWAVVTMDRVVRGAPTSDVEEALERRLELGDDPSREAFWGRTFYVYACYARRYLLDEAAESERRRRWEDLERALSRLEEAGEGHPTFAAHESVLRADVAARRGARREAAAHLEEAEELAADTDNLWVSWEIARLRREWARRRSRGDRAETWLHEMNRIARAAGWERRLRRSRPSSASTSSGLPRGSTTTVDSDSERSARHLDLQRKLDGMLEVSTATSAILDPEEASRAVVDTAIRVLGAQRGLLFLTENEHGATVTVEQPDVVRRADDLEGGQQEGEAASSEETSESAFSTTVVEEVVRRGEAVVFGRTDQGDTIESESIRRAGLRSVVATPIFLEDALFGVLYLDNRLAEGVFDARDAEVLEAIGQHVPLALRTARSAQLEVEVAAERQRRHDAEKLRGFARDVNEMMDVSDILGRLLEEAREMLAADRGWTFSKLGDELVPGARIEGSGEVDRVGRDESGSADVPRPGPLARGVLDGSSVRSISDVQSDERQREPLIAAQDGSWLAASLDSGDDAVGLLVLGWSESRAFEAGDLEFGLALAGQAGVAVEKTQLATVDPLTNAYNRRKFFELAEDEFYRAKRYEQPLSVILLDLDDFTAINDRYGHAAGDAVLMGVADRASDSLRKSDLIARYGGEEFAALLPSTDLAAAREVIGERVREAIAEEPFEFESEELSVTASVGVAQIRSGDDEVRDALERADEALYEAKRAGKNAVRAPESGQ